MYSRSQGEAEFVEAGLYHNAIEKRLQTGSIVPDVRRYSLFHIGAVSGRPAYVSGICRLLSIVQPSQLNSPQLSVTVYVISALLSFLSFVWYSAYTYYIT